MTFYESLQKWMDNSVVDEILLIVIMLAIVEAVAQNTLKTSNYQSFNFIFGLSAYVMIGYLLHYAYHRFPLSKVNVMWSAFSIIFATTLGYMLYDEPINNNNMLSVVFALFAIYFAYE